MRMNRDQRNPAINSKIEIIGTIAGVRDVEDTIRTTKKYTKGAFSKPVQHPQMIQGSDKFPSKVLSEWYEVYPKTEISWDMPYGTALDWLWGEVPIVRVRFVYNYSLNKASIKIAGGAKSVRLLAEGIPGFGKATGCLIAGNPNEQAIKKSLNIDADCAQTDGKVKQDIITDKTANGELKTAQLPARQ